jgi:hypothetical protein
MIKLVFFKRISEHMYVKENSCDIHTGYIIVSIFIFLRLSKENSCTQPCENLNLIIMTILEISAEYQI